MNKQQSWVIETTDDSFERDVLQRSTETPVVVDFWAEWCGPCRMLGPALEELADEYAGRFLLAKADTEAAPRTAAQFNVSSIPAVFAIVNKEPVDTFLGALPKEQIRPWLDRVIAHAQLATATALETTNPEQAERRYRELREADPQDAAAAIGLARVLLDRGRTEECQDLVDELAARGFLEPEAEKLKARLSQKALAGGDLEAARQDAENNPDDLGKQLHLAQLLAAHEQYSEAFDIALQLLAKDRRGVGESAREWMVETFKVLPDDSELLSQYRRKLSMVLY